jgi:uncharacterized caspase-like protein
MIWRLQACAAVIAIALWWAAGPAHAQTRVALVVGNSAYQHAGPLANPARDADAISRLLKEAGFDVVIAQTDLGNLEFKRAIRSFTETAAKADIAVVFYAGHGIEVGGVNYLVPVDAKLAKDYDAEDEAVPLDRIVRAVEPARRLRVIILDACRDNPFVQRMQRMIATRAVARGLAQVEPATSNTLIAYAAKAGSTAEDGNEIHSPFTAALLRHLTVRGVDIRIALGRVRDEVFRNTGGKQEPFVYGSLGGGEISLVPRPPEPTRPSAAEERADYELAERVGTREAWESFLRVHTSGFYADLARAQLTRLARDARSGVEETERERARIARQQAEGAQRERDRLEAERREQADREQAERRQAADKMQMAVMPPREPVAAPTDQPVLSGTALIREIKNELKRVGCYAGQVDEKWTTRETKSSVEKYVRHARLSSTPAAPDRELLESLREQKGRVCPLECSAREVEKNGQCVAKTCKRGQRLDANGRCVAIPAQASKPRRSGRRCYVYQGQSFCE